MELSNLRPAEGSKHSDNFRRDVYKRQVPSVHHSGLAAVLYSLRYQEIMK